MEQKLTSGQSDKVANEGVAKIPSRENLRERAQRHPLVVAISLGLVGIAAYVALGATVSRFVDRRLHDPEVLYQLASRVRPSLVFDDQGTIQADSGAWQYIENLTVEDLKAETDPSITTGLRATMIPTGYVSVDPLVEPLNGRYGGSVFLDCPQGSAIRERPQRLKNTSRTPPRAPRQDRDGQSTTTGYQTVDGEVPRLRTAWLWLQPVTDGGS